MNTQSKGKSTAIGENTKKQAESMMTTAREQMMQEVKEAEKRIAVKVSELAIEFLQKSMWNIFGDKEQKELIQVALKKMRKAD